MRSATAIAGLLLVACNNDEINWVPFNAEDETLTVYVTASEIEACSAPAATTPAATALTTTTAPTIPTTCAEAQAEDTECRITLCSNLGVTPVGIATVDPAKGPVGTEHLVTVIVFDDFESQVGRATVVVDTDEITNVEGEPISRGEGEFEMHRDSADVGAYAMRLQSLGQEGEVREDRFTIHLFQPEELAGEVAAESDE